MSRPGRTARVFREDVRRFPQNAKLFSDEVLIEVLATDTPTRAKAVALAELAVRRMLLPTRYEADVVRVKYDVTGALAEKFGARAFSQFQLECERSAVSTDASHAADRAFRCLNANDGAVDTLYASVLEDAFRPWLTADGVIPVFDSQGAYLLPFSFVGGCEGKAPRVIDASGNEIAEWTEHFRKFAETEGIAADVRVAIQQNEDVPCTGNSMMLPVLMAWWRRRGELPRYDAVRFIATGAFEGERLGLVDTAEKERLVQRFVDRGLLIRPGGGRQRGEIPAGIGREELLQQLRALAEESYDCSVLYAHARLESFERMVRERHWGDWARLCDRLEHLFAGVTDKDPEERLWELMLKSAACCHTGQTEKSHEFNLKARELAAQLPNHRSQLLRLQIEELVILQDEEDFGRVYRLTPDLGKEIDAFAVSENDSNRAVDLRMRYWGTMGQFWLCDAVAHGDAELAKRAFDALDKALKNAGELYSRSKKAHGGQAECAAYANYTQDTNYLLLWTAFFKRADVAEAARRARREADSQRRDGRDGAGADKNDGFRRRLVALAKYRAVLAGDLQLPQSEEDDEVEEMAESAEGWVAATACKYLGASAAWQGNARAARVWFDRALAKMLAIRENGRFCGLVMRVIHMTVFAEAYRSLRSFDSQNDFAQRCRREALAMFAAEDAVTWHKDAWKTWLETEGNAESFPGKKYWY